MVMQCLDSCNFNHRKIKSGNKTLLPFMLFFVHIDNVNSGQKQVDCDITY